MSRVSRKNKFFGGNTVQLFLNKKMGSNIGKAAVLAAAVVSLTFVSASWAAPITIKHSSTIGEIGEITKTSPTPTFKDRDVNAGKFNFNVIASPDEAKWDGTLQAFCIDVDNTLDTKNNVTYDIVAATAASSGWTNLQLAQVSWLFDTQYENLGADTLKNAAFQLTLWEILFETGTKGFSLNEDTGGWRYKTQTTFWADKSFGGARSLANTMLDGIDGVTAAYTSTTWDLFVLNSPFENGKCLEYTGSWKNKTCAMYEQVQVSQNLITVLRKPDDPSVPPQEISEPGTLLLLSAGLGMVFFSTRRRNGAQFASLA